jgi:hypothetical protein
MFHETGLESAIKNTMNLFFVCKKPVFSVFLVKKQVKIVKV